MRKLASKTYVNPYIWLTSVEVMISAFENKLNLLIQKKCKLLPMEYLYPKLHTGSNRQIKTDQQTFLSGIVTQIYLHSFLEN